MVSCNGILEDRSQVFLRRGSNRILDIEIEIGIVGT